MELLSPDILAKIDGAATQKKQQDRIAGAVKRFMDTYDGHITEDEAREYVLSVIPELAEAPPQNAASKPKVPKKAARAKPAAEPDQPLGKSKSARKRWRRAAAKEAAKDAQIPKEKPVPIVGTLPREELVALLKQPLKSGIEFTDEFLETLKQASLAYGYPRELLIRMERETGEPRDPFKVAYSYKAWDTRVGPRERIAVPPEEQLKRQARGKKASDNRIRKLRRTKGMTPKMAARSLVRPANRELADRKKRRRAGRRRKAA